MDTWQGDFGWQAHAMTGRPDLLNYVRTGDLKWHELWAYYEARGLPSGDVCDRCTRLFHQFLSWQLDGEGGLIELSPEIHEDLVGWAAFCVRQEERLSEESLREELARLVESGSISPAYYEAAFHAYVIALVGHHARNWDAEAPVSREGIDAIIPCLEQDRLRVFVPPDPPEMASTEGEPWQRFKRAVAQQQHDAWCASYAVLMERMNEMLDERPSL